MMKEPIEIVHTSSRSADESQVVKFGYVILHDGCTIPQLSTEVFIIPGFYGHNGPIVNLIKGHNLFGKEKKFDL